MFPHLNVPGQWYSLPPTSYPDKLASAKSEFDSMEAMSIICRSSSPWASPLHMVPKASGGWRSCGDYRRLNDATVPGRYPVPHIQYLSAHLASMKVFSKVDLVRGYHQISVAAEDIPKTVISPLSGCTSFSGCLSVRMTLPKLSSAWWISLLSTSTTLSG